MCTDCFDDTTEGMPILGKYFQKEEYIMLHNDGTMVDMNLCVYPEDNPKVYAGINFGVSISDFGVLYEKMKT